MMMTTMMMMMMMMMMMVVLIIYSLCGTFLNELTEAYRVWLTEATYYANSALLF